MKQIKISDLKLLEFVNRVPFFKDFTVNERKAFFTASLAFLQCAKGENIISEGENQTDFFIMLSGSATVLANNGKDAVATIKAGYFIGEGAFIGSRPHSATIQTDSEAFVVKMDQKTLMRFPASIREKINDQIIKGMAVRLSDMNMRYLDMFKMV
jgi:CRP-like cAMP-binding protein